MCMVGNRALRTLLRRHTVTSPPHTLAAPHPDLGTLLAYAAVLGALHQRMWTALSAYGSICLVGVVERLVHHFQRLGDRLFTGRAMDKPV